MNTDLKKGSWSAEEDQKLISYINKYGIWNWSQMPRFAGLSRSGKSCRLRWMNYLKPNVRRGNFTTEEDQIILQSHSLLGNRWSAIASKLPGRTDNDIKNYWHSHLKKHATEHNQTSTQNDSNSTQTIEVDNVAENMQTTNQMNDDYESYFNFEYDSPSSSCNAAFKDHEVDHFGAQYYDTCSPGTIDDLQCFWDQLGPVENLEIVNGGHSNTFSDNIFQDSYNNPTGTSSFYYNENTLPFP